jgi:hypothetical protein
MQGWQPCSVKRIVIAQSQEQKPGSNLAQSSKEVCGTKKTALPMMILYSVLIIVTFDRRIYKLNDKPTINIKVVFSSSLLVGTYSYW